MGYDRILEEGRNSDIESIEQVLEESRNSDIESIEQVLGESRNSDIESIERLLRKARNGNAEAVEHIMILYKPLVRTRAHSYFLAGADREDLVQEGMIGLFKAIRDFKPSENVPFSSFADLCVTRQIVTAVKTSSRKKHIPLNTFLSLEHLQHKNDERDGINNLVESESKEPEKHFIYSEDTRNITSAIKNSLTQFEKQVLSLYLGGSSYQEIGNKLQKTTKSIDNALQRIRKKIAPLLLSDSF